jgi:hypothetical protein
MESKQFTAFDEDLFHLLTEHFGDKWSHVWDAEDDGFYLRLTVHGQPKMWADDDDEPDTDDDELVLSDYEKGYLTAFYETEPDIQKDHADRGEDNLWYGIQVGERMFDLCVWKDEDIVCVVYECFLNDGGFWNTNTDRQWYLKEANNALTKDS